MHCINPIVRAGLLALAMLAGSAAQATYWSLFNIEGEDTLSARYVTYATLDDMLGDTNRLDVFEPNPTGFGRNIVGSGSDSFPAVPEPTSWALLTVGFGLVGRQLRQRRREGSHPRAG